MDVLNFFSVASLKLLLSNYPMKNWLICMCFLPALVLAATTFDTTSLIQPPTSAASTLTVSPASLILALEYDNGDIQAQPETASLQFPAETEENPDNRRCMTVCSKWGEECIMVSVDVVTKKCVRTCKSFAKECL